MSERKRAEAQALIAQAAVAKRPRPSNSAVRPDEAEDRTTRGQPAIMRIMAGWPVSPELAEGRASGRTAATEVVNAARRGRPPVERRGLSANNGLYLAAEPHISR